MRIGIGLGLVSGFLGGMVGVDTPAFAHVDSGGTSLLVQVAQAPDTPFQKGLAAYKAKRDQQALIFFNEAILQAPEDINAHYFLGLTHYRLKQFDAATRYLDYVVVREPDNTSAHFFLGLIYQANKNSIAALEHLEQATKDKSLGGAAYFNIGLAHYRLDNKQMARKAFLASLEIAPDGEMAAGAKDYLDLLNKPEKEDQPWDIDMSAGFFHSDNVTRSENDQVTGKSDFATTFEVSSDYTFKNNSGGSLKVGYGFYQSLYSKIVTQNYQSHSPGISWNQSFDKWAVGVDYTFNYSRLDNEAFLGMHTISPKLSYFPKPWLYSQVYYNLQKKNFFSSASKGRNAITQQVGLNQFFFFLNSKAYLLVGLRGDNENTHGSQFDYQGGKATATVKLPLDRVLFMGNSSWLKDWNAKLGASYRLKDYRGVTTSIAAERLDKIHAFKASLGGPLLGDLSAKAQYVRTKSDSNLSSVNYTENEYSLLLTYGF